MDYRYLILGAGRQGVAAAWDVVHYGKAARVILADQSVKQAKTALRKISSLSVEQIDVRHPSKLIALLKKSDAVLSALPYYLNPFVAKLAVEYGVHYCDLGGFYNSTRAILRLNSQARRNGVTLIPDCGVSPGMCNSLAVCGIKKLDKVEDVLIYCGGLPMKPVGPLGYKVVFSLEGVFGNYFGKAYILRNGKVKEVSSLSQREEIDFGKPIGKLEAAITGGATSTCPWTFKGKVKNYVYKTLRYPGHYQKIDLLKSLGLLETVPIEINGYKVVPRKIFSAVMEKKLKFEGEVDFLILRVIVQGKIGRRDVEVRYDLLDNFDSKTGLSAMQRTTGFSSAIVLEMLAQGLIQERGVVPVERSVPAELFLQEIRKRGIVVKETLTEIKRGESYAKK